MILTRRNWINISFPELFEDRALAMQDQVRGYRFQQHRRSNAQQHHGVRLRGKAHDNPLRPGDVMNAEPTQSLLRMKVSLVFVNNANVLWLGTKIHAGT
jgi:hypothetical protein